MSSAREKSVASTLSYKISAKEALIPTHALLGKAGQEVRTE